MRNRGDSSEIAWSFGVGSMAYTADPATHLNRRQTLGLGGHSLLGYAKATWEFADSRELSLVIAERN